jgi:hypothetical protein
MNPSLIVIMPSILPLREISFPEVTFTAGAIITEMAFSAL